MSSMIKVPKNCTGCAACSALCPHNAIDMKPDSEGFRYPEINTELCVNCGICANVCPVSNNAGQRSQAKRIVAVRTKNEQIRLNSSSGGFFTMLASKIIEHDGIVYGAAFSPNFKRVRHIGIETAEELRLLRGSKYIQCENDRMLFREIKSKLKDGRLVLFSGTPCQVEGLKSFLGKDYENLLTADMICHGVPSPEVWRSYLAELEKENGSPVCSVNFRNKVSGWKKYSFSAQFENGRDFTVIVTENPYMRAFVRSVTIRKSCYSCPFRKLERISDFTMADFWGCEKAAPEMNDNTGITLTFINSEKGAEFFGGLSDTETSEIDKADALRENQSMYIQTDYNFNRDYFFDNFGKSPAAALLRTAADRQTLFTRAVGKYRRIKRKIGDK